MAQPTDRQRPLNEVLEVGLTRAFIPRGALPYELMIPRGAGGLPRGTIPQNLLASDTPKVAPQSWQRIRNTLDRDMTRVERDLKQLINYADKHPRSAPGMKDVFPGWRPPPVPKAGRPDGKQVASDAMRREGMIKGKEASPFGQYNTQFRTPGTKGGPQGGGGPSSNAVVPTMSPTAEAEVQLLEDDSGTGCQVM